MSWLWLIVIVPVVASLGFAAGATFAASIDAEKAYKAGYAAGRRSPAENGSY